MACKSASVERLADKTVKARKQIDKLQADIEAQAAVHKTKFLNKINEHLANAKVTDGREIGYQSNIKTEYTSEFSLDKIAKVVTSALEAIKAKATSPLPITPEVIQSYSDMVNAVAEAAKSASNSASSLAFSMNRLEPGTFGFLFASTINIQDDETFGTEAVTTTAIYHQIVQSQMDLELQGEFDFTKQRIQNDLVTYEKLRSLQLLLLDQLANDAIDMDTYDKKDLLFQTKITEIEDRIHKVSTEDEMAHKSDDDVILMTNNATMNVALMAKNSVKSFTPNTRKSLMENRKVILKAIQKLSLKGDRYQNIIKKANTRISNGYFS